MTAPIFDDGTAGWEDLCTGVSASWCPVHGDCTCPGAGEGESVDLNHPLCPLHSPWSRHAEDPNEPPEGSPRLDALWEAWARENLHRCPPETGEEAARRRATGLEPECTALTVAHLRRGVVVLGQATSTRNEPRFGVARPLEHPEDGWGWELLPRLSVGAMWHYPNTEDFFYASELRVLP